MSSAIFSAITMALPLLAQTAPADAGVSASPATRLEFMKESVRGYEMSVSRGENAELTLQAEPAFRLGKQGTDGLVDGAIFFWTGASGRPEVAIQAFLIKTTNEPEGLWVHEFTSLAPAPLTARRQTRMAWAPREAGLVFRAVPGAPKPGESPAQRQRQIREIAEKFRASDDFHNKGWSELRLLTKPIARYGKPGTDTPDGALFALVLGTDPEVFVFLEMRTGQDGPEWQFAVAPMTVYALKVSYKDAPIWSAPNREPANDPSRPFYDNTYTP